MASQSKQPLHEVKELEAPEIQRRYKHRQAFQVKQGQPARIEDSLLRRYAENSVKKEALRRRLIDEEMAEVKESPTINPASKEIAEALLDKIHPARQQALIDQTLSQEPDQLGFLQDSKATEDLPRCHVSLVTKTCSKIFLATPAKSSLVTLPEDIVRRHQPPPPEIQEERELDVVERNKKFVKDKQEWYEKAQEKQYEEDMAKCPFKPSRSNSRASSSKNSHKVSVSFASKASDSSYSDLFLRKKHSVASTPIPTQLMHVKLHTPSKVTDNLRIPPPNDYMGVDFPEMDEEQVGGSRYYASLTPVSVTASYRAGCDFEGIRARAEKANES